MTDRTKLLVHLRRLSNLFEGAFRNGPDGTLEGKYAEEHPAFIHHSCAFYLAGCLAYLEGEDGSSSWEKPSAYHSDFDSFVSNHPSHPTRSKESFESRGINKATMNALACIRNAVVHHAGDLAKNRNTNCVTIVQAANIPGVNLAGTMVNLDAPFLGFVRLAALAVRYYHGDY